jgi:hypothetical protein
LATNPGEQIGLNKCVRRRQFFNRLRQPGRFFAKGCQNGKLIAGKVAPDLLLLSAYILWKIIPEKNSLTNLGIFGKFAFGRCDLRDLKYRQKGDGRA